MTLRSQRMTTKSNSGELSIVNATGFAFQLAVEELVQGSQDEHGWTVTSREHGWHNSDGEPRFIDLVLTNGRMHMIIECKRVRDTQWVFLVPDPPKGRRAEPRRHFRAAFCRHGTAESGSHPTIGLTEFQVDPRCWESAFCAARGMSDRGDTPLLDRVCAELTTAADAILSQQALLNRVPHPGNDVWITVPVIVTTAEISICKFDPGAVSLVKGELDQSAVTVESVPVVRYRKSFNVHASAEDHRGTIGALLHGIGALEVFSQRTVFVVSAGHLAKWLSDFTLDLASYASFELYNKPLSADQDGVT